MKQQSSICAKSARNKWLIGTALRCAPVCQAELRISSCCTRDEGRPLGIDVKAWVPNRLKLLWSRAMVVSVKDKVLL